MTVFVDPTIGGDQTGYVSAGKEFATSGGTVLERRSPGYAIFLAATLWLGPLGIYAIQSLMTLGTAVLTQRVLGWWQGLAIAACPFFVIWEWALLTETLCLTALWCGWLLVLWKRPPKTWIGTLLLGVAVITRPLFILIPLFAAALLLIRGSRPRALVVLTAYVPILAALFITTGSSFLGLNLWIGTWERNPHWIERSAIEWPNEAQMTPSERAKLPLLPQAGNEDHLFMEAAAARYNKAPLEALNSWFVRYKYLWIGTRTAFVEPEPATVGWFAYKGSMWLLNTIVLVLGCVGGVLALRRRDCERILLIPIAYVALIHLPFHSTETRYSVVALPFLIALAIYASSSISGTGVLASWKLRRTQSAKPRRSRLRPTRESRAPEPPPPVHSARQTASRR